MIKATYVFLLIVLLGTAALNTSCNKKRSIQMGYLEYKISYPELDSNNVLVKFLPQKMVMAFKNGNYLHDMRAGMGLFQTGFIHYASSNRVDYFLKVANVKHRSSFDETSFLEFNRMIPKFKVVETDETQTKLGLDCKKVQIDYIDPAEKDYDLWYSDWLDAKAPNSGTPFASIPGVMMNFELERYGLKMRFEAMDLIFAEVPDSDFELDESFEEVSNQVMERKVKETFVSFQL